MDTAAQERFGSMTRIYYKEASGALIVLNCTRRESFEAVEKWKRDLDARLFLLPCP
jgi:Ras-related protein Rab-32